MEIVQPPQDVFEAPGTDVVFEVELNKDRVEVKWLRNNMPVVQGDKHQMMSEGKIHRLQVCEIRPRDQGEYRIIAKDKDAKAKLELAGRNPKLTPTESLTEVLWREFGNFACCLSQRCPRLRPQTKNM